MMLNPCSPCCTKLACTCCKPRDDTTPSEEGTTYTATLDGLDSTTRIYITSDAAGLTTYTRAYTSKAAIDAAVRANPGADTPDGQVAWFVVKADFNFALDGEYAFTPDHTTGCISDPVPGDPLVPSDYCAISSWVNGEGGTTELTTAVSWEVWQVTCENDVVKWTPTTDVFLTSYTEPFCQFTLWYDSVANTRGLKFRAYVESYLGTKIEFAFSKTETEVADPYVCDELSAEALTLDSWTVTVPDLYDGDMEAITAGDLGLPEDGAGVTVSISSSSA